MVADALDRDALGRAVSDAAPDVIVHALTTLPKSLDVRHFDREFALTNGLRTERGASNAKARRQLKWRLRHPSRRQGFVEGLG